MFGIQGGPHLVSCSELMRCDDIFERSGKINNSRCRKKKLCFKQQVQATVQSFKLKQLQNLHKQISKSLSPLPFTFSLPGPQIEGAAAGRAWLWACAGKVGKRRATFLDTYARELFRVVIHLWMFDSKNGIRTYLFHFFSINRCFVTFPRSICGSVASAALRLSPKMSSLD